MTLNQRTQEHLHLAILERQTMRRHGGAIRQSPGLAGARI